MLDRNLQEIIARIEKARIAYSRHQIIKIIAISKYQDTQAITELYQAGQRAFGENKVQDLKHKSEALVDFPLEWHFVGTLQSNKINALLGMNPAMIQSIHNIDIALSINQKLAQRNQTLRVLLQVNSAKENTKSGFMPEELLESYQKIQETCPHLKLCGLMSIGAHSDDYHAVKNSFEITKSLFDQLQGAEVLSMGMSHDFELAIACGSNMVRIGSLLFQKGHF